MEQYCIYVVVVGLNLIYASSSLKTEDVNVVVFTRQRKRLLARELAPRGDTRVANVEGLLAGSGTLFKVYFVHFDKTIV